MRAHGGAGPAERAAVWRGHYVPRIEHGPSGSNPRVMRACWLMWTFSSCHSHVDGDMWRVCTCTCVFVCECGMIQCVEAWDPLHSWSTATAWASVNQYEGKRITKLCDCSFLYGKIRERWIIQDDSEGLVIHKRAHGLCRVNCHRFQRESSLL